LIGDSSHLLPVGRREFGHSCKLKPDPIGPDAADIDVIANAFGSLARFFVDFLIS